MKLNHDCIRDLLLYIEENSSYSNKINLNYITLKNYSTEEILYTADKLIEANLLDCIRANQFTNSLPSIIVRSITFEGHKFLDNIRDNVVWKNTKNILSKFTSTSIGMVGDIASQVISKIISQQLNLP